MPHGTEEEEFYKRKHLENNPEAENRCYLVGEELRVVVVRIGWARVSDYRGGVRDYQCLDPGSAEAGEGGGFGMENRNGSGNVNGSGGLGAGLTNGT